MTMIDMLMNKLIGKTAAGKTAAKGAAGGDAAPLALDGAATLDGETGDFAAIVTRLRERARGEAEGKAKGEGTTAPLMAAPPSIDPGAPAIPIAATPPEAAPSFATKGERTDMPSPSLPGATNGVQRAAADTPVVATTTPMSPEAVTSARRDGVDQPADVGASLVTTSSLAETTGQPAPAPTSAKPADGRGTSARAQMLAGDQGDGRPLPTIGTIAAASLATATQAALSPAAAGEAASSGQAAMLGVVAGDFSRPIVLGDSPRPLRPMALPTLATGEAIEGRALPALATQVPVPQRQPMAPDSAAAATDDGAADAFPARAIFDGLPPMIQSQLAAGAPAITPAATPAIAIGAANPAPDAAAALGDRVIDMGVDGQWIDRMAREITQVAQGTGHSQFQLMPPHLGRIQIDLWQGEQSANIRLTTETDEAADRLRAAAPGLQADARVQALALGTISVEKAQTMQDQPQQQSGWSGQQRHSADAQMGNQAQGGAQGHGQGQGQGQGQASGSAAGQRDNKAGTSWTVQQPMQDGADTARPENRAADGRVRFA